LENVSINSRREKGIYFRLQDNKKTKRQQKWGFIVPIIEKPEIGGLLKKEAT
jgi:hypothetical protein